MKTTTPAHPLIDHKMTILRQTTTSSPQFRDLTAEIVRLLTFEATRDLPTVEVSIETPVSPAVGRLLAPTRPILIPILRAGLGMLPGIQELLPTAEVGFLGIKRDEETLEPYTYANRLPNDLTGRHVYLLDPMLATGGTLVDSLDYVFQRGAREVTVICLLAAPEGIQRLEEHLNQNSNTEISVHLVVAAIDQKLNEHGYIVPGLGDAGDRLFGTI